MLVLPLILALSMPAEAQTREGGDRTPPKTEEPAPRTGGGERGGGSREPEPTPTPKPAPAPVPNKGTADRTPDKGKKGKKKKKKGYKIDAVNPLYGTFVYGPKPGSHHKYTGAAAKKRKTTVAKKDMPERKVDRKQRKFFGLQGGGMFYGDSGESISQAGAGLALGFRPFEAIGFQVDLMHHADGFPGAERANTLLGASGELFLFPWAGVSPYAHFGVVQNFRGGGGISNGIGSVWGPRGGLGLQLAMGKSAAFDVQGTVIGWQNQKPDDGTSPAAGQLTGSLVFHF